jgi:hypothetical protein
LLLRFVFPHLMDSIDSWSKAIDDNSCEYFASYLGRIRAQG